MYKAYLNRTILSFNNKDYTKYKNLQMKLNNISIQDNKLNLSLSFKVPDNLKTENLKVSSGISVYDEKK